MPKITISRSCHQYQYYNYCQYLNHSMHEQKLRHQQKQIVFYYISYLLRPPASLTQMHTRTYTQTHKHTYIHNVKYIQIYIHTEINIHSLIILSNIYVIDSVCLFVCPSSQDFLLPQNLET